MFPTSKLRETQGYLRFFFFANDFWYLLFDMWSSNCIRVYFLDVCPCFSMYRCCCCVCCSSSLREVRYSMKSIGVCDNFNLKYKTSMFFDSLIRTMRWEKSSVLIKLFSIYIACWFFQRCSILIYYTTAYRFTVNRMKGKQNSSNEVGSCCQRVGKKFSTNDKKQYWHNSMKNQIESMVSWCPISPNAMHASKNYNLS